MALNFVSSARADEYDIRDQALNEANRAKYRALAEQKTGEIEAEVYRLYAKMAASHDGITAQKADIVIAGATFLMLSRSGFSTGSGLACRTMMYNIECAGSEYTKCPKPTLFGVECIDSQQRRAHMQPNGQLVY